MEPCGTPQVMPSDAIVPSPSVTCTLPVKYDDLNQHISPYILELPQTNGVI